MRIARVMLLAALTFTIAGLVPVAAAGSAAAETLTFRGSTASTVFRTRNDCIATEVDVIAGENFGPSGGQSFAIVLIDRRDMCDGTLLMFGSGVGLGADFAVGPRLSWATVRGVVPFADLVSGQTLQVAVDASWTATGPLQLDADHSHYVDDGVVVKTHSNGTFRPAAATGHVATAEIELAPAGTTAAGQLYWSNYGQVVIQPR
jgi:hypothetical protein